MMPASSVLTQTDLPLPVVPAISRWGILARSMVMTFPSMSLPRPTHSLEEFSRTALQSTISRKPTISFFVLGASIPMAALPGMGASTRMPGAARRSAISSAKFTTELTLTPGAGSSSYRVTDGPRVTPVTFAFTLKSASVCSSIRHCSLTSASNRLWSVFSTGFNRSSGGNLYSCLGNSSVFCAFSSVN